MAQEQSVKVDADLIRRTNALLEQAAQRAPIDRATERRGELVWREQHRAGFEAAAQQGGWAPEWVTKPTVQLSQQQIVEEAQVVVQQHQRLTKEYLTAPEERRAELRQELQPLADRARELRQEYSSRQPGERAKQKVAEEQVGFGH